MRQKPLLSFNVAEAEEKDCPQLRTKVQTRRSPDADAGADADADADADQISADFVS